MWGLWADRLLTTLQMTFALSQPILQMHVQFSWTFAFLINLRDISTRKTQVTYTCTCIGWVVLCFRVLHIIVAKFLLHLIIIQILVDGPDACHWWIFVTCGNHQKCLKNHLHAITYQIFLAYCKWTKTITVFFDKCLNWTPGINIKNSKGHHSC